jgi:hypothetical protein
MLSTSRPSHVGSAYITTDGTQTGDPVSASSDDLGKEFNPWSETKTVALSGDIVVNHYRATWRDIRVNIRECPHPLYKALVSASAKKKDDATVELIAIDSIGDETVHRFDSFIRMDVSYSRIGAGEDNTFYGVVVTVSVPIPDEPR